MDRRPPLHWARCLTKVSSALTGAHDSTTEEVKVIEPINRIVGEGQHCAVSYTMIMDVGPTWRTIVFLSPPHLAKIVPAARIRAAEEGGSSMEDRLMTLGIQVAAVPNDNSEEMAEATVRLRRELLDLDVEAVELPRAGEPPPGTRAVDLADLGALVVTVAPQLLTSVVAAVSSWLARSQQRSIRLELDGDALELTSVSSKEQRRLTDEWLRRHAFG